MKKSLVNNLWNILKTAVLVGVFGLLIYQLIFKPEKDENNVANIISLDNKLSDTLRDQKGQLHAQKEIVYIPTFSIAEALYKEKIDSLTKELNLSKEAKINSMGTITTTTETSFKPTIITDTVTHHITLSYKNKWSDINLSTDTSIMSKLRYRDSLIFTTITEPYGFLKLKERQYIDVKSANKDVKQIGVTFFQVAPVKNNRSRIGLGLGIGPGLAAFHEGGEIKVKPTWITVQAGLQYRF